MEIKKMIEKIRENTIDIKMLAELDIIYSGIWGEKENKDLIKALDMIIKSGFDVTGFGVSVGRNENSFCFFNDEKLEMFDIVVEESGALPAYYDGAEMVVTSSIEEAIGKYGFEEPEDLSLSDSYLMDEDENIWFVMEKDSQRFRVALSDILSCLKFAEEQGDVPQIDKDWWKEVGKACPEFEVQ